MTLSVEPIVRHVVKYFEADEETEVIDLSIKVEDRSVEDLDFTFVKKLLVILPHCLFALLSEERRYLDEDILTVPIHIKVIVLVEVEH